MVDAYFPPMPHTRTRIRRLIWLVVSSAIAYGLLLFGFCVLHGLNESDPFYRSEWIGAWSLAVLGIASAIYGIKHGRRRQRLVAIIALALIASSIPVLTLLKRSPASPPPLPQATE